MKALDNLGFDVQQAVISCFKLVVLDKHLIAGVAVAAAAYAGKCGIAAWQAFKARPPRPKFRKFYEGGFQAAVTWRESVLILCVRVKDALRHDSSDGPTVNKI